MQSGTPPSESERLALEPLRVEHADELVSVLADPALYTVIGGEPPSLDRLRERYRAQLAGSGDPGERWFNWVIRLRDGAAAVGYVQATVTDNGRAADVAWVLGTAWQGHGYAAEAAGRMAQALAEAGVTTLTAHIHPEHPASAAVARRIGLRPTGRLDDDGEQVWEGDA
jgi:RimJ/RimL family protein N-acetyltransferase